MVTRRAQDQGKETLKQPYQTTVSIEWLPCLCIDAASYHEACQKMQLLEEGGYIGI